MQRKEDRRMSTAKKDPKTIWKKRLTFLGNEALFLGVIVIAFIILKIIPFIYSITYSFTDWNGISSEIHFNGLSNYKNLLADKQFWNSMWFTAKFSVATLIGQNLIGFILAYFLIKPIRGRNIIRAGYYLPNVLGGLILGFIWRFIFLKIFPAIGKATKIGFFTQVWLGTPDTAYWGLLIVQIWSHMGYYMLLYVAGFMAIPNDCLESAKIDGAGKLNMLFSVEIPLLMPTITRCLFLSITTCFRVYNLNLALTSGGPFLSSEAVTMNIYRTAFTEDAMGYGSAKSLVLSLIVIIITFIQVGLTSKKEVEI